MRIITGASDLERGRVRLEFDYWNQVTRIEKNGEVRALEFDKDDLYKMLKGFGLEIDGE